MHPIQERPDRHPGHAARVHLGAAQGPAPRAPEVHEDRQVAEARQAPRPRPEGRLCWPRRARLQQQGGGEG